MDVFNKSIAPMVRNDKTNIPTHKTLSPKQYTDKLRGCMASSQGTCRERTDGRTYHPRHYLSTLYIRLSQKYAFNCRIV